MTWLYCNVLLLNMIGHDEECFIPFLNTKKWIGKTMLSWGFLTNFEVLGNQMKHCLECLV